MGQYYNVIVRRNGEDKVYNREVNGEYTMAKLMEHSWWENNFCRALAKTLVDNPAKVCWCGDYAEEDECSELGFNYNDVWGEKDGCSIEGTDFSLSSVKYLVNNDKRCYVDLEEYYSMCNRPEELQGKMYDRCIFPISLLTALGNGRGGGDYREENDDVGSWAFDEIYLTNTLPEGYTKEEYCFVEEY